LALLPDRHDLNPAHPRPVYAAVDLGSKPGVIALTEQIVAIGQFHLDVLCEQVTYRRIADR